MYQTAIDQRVFRRSVGAALLFTAMLVVIPTATPAAELLTRSVKISDLNLASPQGQQTLARRLRAAIDQVCAASEGTNALRVSRPRIEGCRQSAWADAQHQLQQHGLRASLTVSR